ncbi:LAFA_0C08152g1_1 [Lachancea sp. 'fantastica']|nr:LAFA_0C08152g1_1 [Lachancea sp. 'fantastica']
MDSPNPFLDDVDDNFSDSLETGDYGAAFQRPNSPPPVLPADANNVKTNSSSSGQYAALYQIDTDTFRSRLLTALKARKIQTDGGRFEPDLYSPVWVTMTAAAAHFYVRSLFNFLVSFVVGRSTKATSAGRLVTPYMVFAISYTAFSPALVHILARFVLKVKSEFGLIELISLYGYSMAIWIPLALVNLILLPLEFLIPHLFTVVIYWTRIMVGLAHTAIFFYQQFKTEDQESDWKKLFITTLAVSTLCGALLELTSSALK